MADILIRGMEMPKNGEHTTITVYGDGVWCAHFDNEPHGKAVPLPEKHGRLGDLDAMYIQLHSLYHGAISDSELYVYEALGMISNAPTIVPAEGGEGDA